VIVEAVGDVAKIRGYTVLVCNADEDQWVNCTV
jgi:predicted RNA-binding protein with TRAM domain